MHALTAVVPTHDRRETAVLAVRSVLAQTRPAAQVLVLCDGCSDDTAEAVRSLGDARVEALELPKAPNYGYAHRNESLRRAEGDVITWLGDDDLMLPDHLEQIGALWDAGVADLVQAPATLVHPGDRLEAMGMDWSVPSNRARVEYENRTPMGAVSISVRTAISLGGWNADLPRAADWDLWLRALAAGARPAMTAEPTILHFRAAWREQAWSDRVRQNAEWLGRMGAERTLTEMRVALRRAHAESKAAAAAERDRLRIAVAEAAAERDRLRGQLDALAPELEYLRERERTLQAILSGGWWRLRSRLLPVLRLGARISRR